MNWNVYSKYWNSHAPSQEKFEYFLFLQFVESYFKMKEIYKPVVVEIGVRGVAQASYYINLLNAEYTGIDIAAKNSNLVIEGDSHDPATVEKLKEKLAGRPINLLFIDGWHSYESAKADWDLYSPLTENLVGIHDINWKINYFPDDKHHNPEGDMPSVRKLWQELYDQNHSMVSFQCPGTIEVDHGEKGKEKFYGDPGIGVVVLDRSEIETRWVFKESRFKKMWGENGRAYPRIGNFSE